MSAHEQESEQGPGHGQSPDGGRGAPDGGPFEWVRRGMQLLDGGDAAAAAVLLERAAAESPRSSSLCEALGRAHFDSGRVGPAAEQFERLVELEPTSHYAHFGLGLALSRLGRFVLAAEHLSMAVAMRPERREYAEALRRVRATIAARRDAGQAPSA